MMRVQLFAVAKQLTGRESIELDLPPGSTVADVRARLQEAAPALASVMNHLQFAVNAEYAADETRIPAGADVACIPPVSGG